MKLRIHYMDSLTGEEYVKDIEAGFDPQSILNHFNKEERNQGAEKDNYTCMSWNLDKWQSTACFVLLNVDEGAYSGYFITGFVHTHFI